MRSQTILAIAGEKIEIGQVVELGADGKLYPSRIWQVTRGIAAEQLKEGQTIVDHGDGQWRVYKNSPPA